MADLIPAARESTIVFQAGDDTPAVVPVPDRLGRPIDITSWAAVAVVTANGSEVHRWSTFDGSATAGPDGVTLLADDSEDWAWRRGRFDVRVWAPDGTRRVVGFGDTLVRPMAGASADAPAAPAPTGAALVMRHGDSWQPPDSPRLALHAGGVPLPLEQWWVRAQARMDGSARPLFSWTARLSATGGTGVEVDTAFVRRRDPATGAPVSVELPAMWLRLDPEDWNGKPREWEGALEVELTRGSISEPLERKTIVAGRPLRIVPDVIS